MDNSNINKYCPNQIYSSESVSIGEFKTIDDFMSYPLHEIWCINRIEDNKFEQYKQQGYTLLIICCWKRKDSQRFVLTIAKQGHLLKYFDLNDLPMDLIAEDFENSLGNEALGILQSY